MFKTTFHKFFTDFRAIQRKNSHHSAWNTDSRNVCPKTFSDLCNWNNVAFREKKINIAGPDGLNFTGMTFINANSVVGRGGGLSFFRLHLQLVIQLKLFLF